MEKEKKGEKNIPKKIDFMKETNETLSEDSSEEETEESDEDSHKGKGFFSRSPLNSASSYGSCLEDDLLTPKPFKSNTAKRIEKEELWRLSVSKSTKKRLKDSPPEGQSAEKSKKKESRIPQFFKSK